MAADRMMENNSEGEDLFDSALLDGLDMSKSKTNLYGLTPDNPGENLCMRPLSTNDFDKGYLDVLKQLTKVGDLSRQEYEDRFHAMKASKDTYFVFVIEHTVERRIIATVSLIVELKFIHHCAMRGRIEDVVVLKDFRGRNLGKLLLETATRLAEKLGCYKISLECDDDMVPYYNLFGYKHEKAQNYLCQRFFS